jgi:hypothetical protein
MPEHPFDRLRARAYPYPSRLTLGRAARLRSFAGLGQHSTNGDEVPEV